MAQLNPNFEIDFSDINSYEQIQLINDTQIAKENLFMHRAYKEPSDDEIIRNHFSSFTFVDFCPKLFAIQPTIQQRRQQQQDNTNDSPATTTTNNSRSLKCYELETFSDLFERINAWLKLNKDWRVVSMETLVYDCTSQFNHLKSSIHSSYLPQNTRGLRLFLSPSKSRFSGPQKIGCINVVPRKVSGSHSRGCKYETLDDILHRLNDLLLTRPIEGRILSVETITLPMVNGYVNTETNYFMDSRLNLLNQRTYSVVTGTNCDDSTSISSTSSSSSSSASASASASSSTSTPTPLSHSPPSRSASPSLSRREENETTQPTDSLKGHNLIDILRVYYEFGPKVCGLVNLIDFIPRFYPSPTTNATNDRARSPGPASNELGTPAELNLSEKNPTLEQPLDPQKHKMEKIPATESLTRLIRRSLAWFEAERKLILNQQTDTSAELAPELAKEEVVKVTSSRSSHKDCDQQHMNEDGTNNPVIGKSVNLRVCNLQVHHKTLLKNQLIQVNPSNALQIINTRAMAHERASKISINCAQCKISAHQNSVQDWCSHLIELTQPYQLKFVRLAYVVPVYDKCIRSIYSMHLPSRSNRHRQQQQQQQQRSKETHTDSGQPVMDNNTISSSTANLITVDNEQVYTMSGEDEDARILSRNGSSSSDTSSLSSTQDLPPNEFVKISNDDLQKTTINDDDDDDDDVAKTLIERKKEEKGENEHMIGDNNEEERNLKELLEDREFDEERAKQAALEAVNETNRRHEESELANQLNQLDDGLMDSPIGQLTYRLFAPCQLVNSSSCFSINPVNSSSPLASRGSVDLIGGGISSENAHPSSLLLGGLSNQQTSNVSGGNSGGSCNELPQVVTSFGAFFPALSQDATNVSSQLLDNPTHLHRNSIVNNISGTTTKFRPNEFESVDAIKRRMEIYVTTNSMKVVAGETLVVNLSDALSCLSTAIEQTVTKTCFAIGGPPSTWVSVHILYAAVDEPQLPNRLLAQQKLKELTLIDLEAGEKNLLEREADKLFDDDFNGTLASSNNETNNNNNNNNQKNSSLKANPLNEPSTSTYDRTVALPTQPEVYANNLEPVEFLGSQTDCLWLNEDDLIEAQQKQLQMQTIDLGTRRKRKKKLKNRHEDSQCSLI